MNFLIAGLGNIGAEYADTRHNIGFKVLDAFAKASGTSFISGRYGSTCTVSVRGHKLILLKPSTYMNLSGECIREVCSYYRIDPEKELIVLYHNGLHPLVEQKFSVFLPDTMPIWSEDPVEQQYRSQYIISGIEAIVRVWVTRGFQESIEEVVQIARHAQEKQIPIR